MNDDVDAESLNAPFIPEKSAVSGSKASGIPMSRSTSARFFFVRCSSTRRVVLGTISLSCSNRGIVPFVRAAIHVLMGSAGRARFALRLR
jgi:hypothetical protein